VPSECHVLEADPSRCIPRPPIGHVTVDCCRGESSWPGAEEASTGEAGAPPPADAVEKAVQRRLDVAEETLRRRLEAHCLCLGLLPLPLLGWEVADEVERTRAEEAGPHRFERAAAIQAARALPDPRAHPRLLH
jgi:hypothetical protein